MKILVVDDDSTTRKVLGLYLRAKGFDAVAAENGIDAMEKLGATAVQLIMTDINMPFMDGIEFVKNVRANPGWDQIPILVVSTEADQEEQQRAFAAGANGYLIKPVTADMVIGTIRKLLKDMFVQGGNKDA